MISFKVSQLDLIALKLNNVKISNNTIMIVLIAKGTQGMTELATWVLGPVNTATFSNENGVKLLRVCLALTLLCCENGAFRKR